MTRIPTPIPPVLILATILCCPLTAPAHCQLPCGIYGDNSRFAALFEHISTIEKAMREINALAGKQDAQSIQQVARWTANKESHANDIQHIAQAYFLAQRSKLPKDGSEGSYTGKLKLVHQIIIYAMKCKQTVDTANAANLEKAVRSFQQAYQ